MSETEVDTGGLASSFLSTVAHHQVSTESAEALDPTLTSFTASSASPHDVAIQTALLSETAEECNVNQHDPTCRLEIVLRHSQVSYQYPISGYLLRVVCCVDAK